VKPSKNGHKPEPSPSPLEPPKDKKAELALLGSILLESEQIDEVALVLGPDDFYWQDHQWIYAAALDLHQAGKAADPVVVFDALNARHPGHRIKAEDLVAAMESVPHGGHARFYADIVRDKSMRRVLIATGTDVVRDGYDPTFDVDDLAGMASDRMLSVLERSTRSEQTSIRDLLIDALYEIGNGKTLGLLSGYPDLDKITNGFQAGNMIVVGARPGMGKTSWAGSIALSIAGRGQPVGFITLEQSKLELAERFLSAQSELGMHHMRGGGLTEREHERIAEAASSLDRLPIYLDEAHHPTPTALEAAARLLVRRHKVEIILIDYLQLVCPEDRRMPREQQVADTSRRIKALAKTLRIPIVVLAQLNREIEKRDLKDRRPRLSDLRESGSLEQDADVVIFIHRPEFYAWEDRPGQAEIVVAKHRNGPRGTVKLHFDKATMRFTEPTPEERLDPQTLMAFDDQS